jgi:hypothetical protein
VFMAQVLIKYAALALIALVAAVVGWSNDAQAQGVKLYYACPYGPGPGEEEHHREPQYDTQGRIYNYLIFCVEADQAPQQQEQYRSPPPPPPTPKTYTDAYYSVVVHPNAKKVWASARRFTLEDARKDSLAYCTKMMGKGCTIATSGVNNDVYVYMLTDGSLIMPNDREWSTETAKILKNCQQLIRCAQADRITSPQIATEVGAPINDVSYYVIPENNADLYNRFGAIAWTGAGKKIWTSGGHKTRVEAESAAVGLCQKSQGTASQSCEIAIATGNALMIVWMDKQKNIQFDNDFPAAANITPKLNWEYFRNICKTKKPKCTLKQLVDAREPGEFERLVN